MQNIRMNSYFRTIEVFAFPVRNLVLGALPLSNVAANVSSGHVARFPFGVIGSELYLQISEFRSRSWLRRWALMFP